MEEHRYDKASLCSEFENITARWMSAVDIWLERRTRNGYEFEPLLLRGSRVACARATAINLERLEHTLCCKRCQSRLSHAELDEGQQT
jgi:hypothetical protein